MSELTVAAIQSVPVPNDLEGSVGRHVRLVSRAIDHGASFVIFPELSLTGYDHDLTLAQAVAGQDERLRPLQALADAHDVIIVVGAPIVSPAGLHIGSICLMPGAPPQTYVKQHLHGGEELAFAPGHGGPSISRSGEIIGLAICADVTHLEHPRNAVRDGATIYAASVLFTESAYAEDARILQQHARTHRIVVLMANYGAPMGRWSSAGKSAIWSGDGCRLACAPAAGESLLIGERSDGHWTARMIEC